MHTLKPIASKIDVASNGEEAIHLFAENEYDVVLMDVQMPKMDGYEATRQIKALEEKRNPAKKTPIIAMTAHATKDEMQMCLDSGMVAFLSKPFKTFDACELIQSLIE
jgi:CheY-like chemotaxis protein